MKIECTSGDLLEEVCKLFDLNEEQAKRMKEVIEEAVSSEWTYDEFYEMAGLAEVPLLGQPQESENYLDDDGNPEGGYVEGPGLSIRWQRGAIDDEHPWNGCFFMSVLRAAENQLKFYQSTKFVCDDNQEALEKIQEAHSILERRMRARFCRGVWGQHKK